MMLKVVLAGICLTAVLSQDCSWIRSLDCSGYKYDPVCGSDFITYGTRCAFAKNRCRDDELDILAVSSCSAAGFSTRGSTMPTTKATTPRPITDRVTNPTTVMPMTDMTTKMPTTMGTTHKPVFNGHDLVVDFFCLELSHETCPDNTEAVCGSDGQLYPNFCEFEKHRCSHRNLTADHFTAC